MNGEERHNDKATPRPEHGRWGITISSGIHQGVGLDALSLPITIGSDLACDVVLGDQGVKPRHLHLYCDRGILFAAALQGPVDIHGQGHLPPGHGVRVQLPLDVTIGNARLRLHQRIGNIQVRPFQAFWSKRAWRRKRQWILASAIVAVMVAGPAVFAGFSPTSDRQIAASHPSEQLRNHIDHDEVDVFLRHALAANQLTELTLHRDGAAWTISGDLDPSSYQRWLDVRETAETRYGPQLVIESKVNSNGMTPPHLAIAAIRLGEHPYIVDDSGQRHALGAALSDGWIISRLDNKALVLRHGTNEHTLSY